MKKSTKNLALIVFLLGIFMGAIDTGIVSPARTIISEGFSISSNLSVWMITLYSLAYAVSMPISAKISDRFGRRKIYTISISIFAFGSLLCGIAGFVGTYSFFLTARLIQAIGGGGIMPIATAYIGESFPPEKRGSALGAVGSIFGIATVLGPTLGSTIINLAGAKNWGLLFFINLPISIILASKIYEEKIERVYKKMDLRGSIIITVMILSLMYALTNLNFFQFYASIRKLDVLPFLLIFVITIPVFIHIEKKADDPVMNLNFFTDRNIRTTLILSFIVGCGMMGVIFLPQFGENILKIKLGSGGYIVTLMAIFSGVAAPLGGIFIDKYGAKIVLLIGFTCTIIGSLTLAFYTANNPSFASLLIGLIFIGLGMVFTMGTPINYLMMNFTKKEDASVGQSTVSLIRSIGLTISPNILIGFISQAGLEVQTKLFITVNKLAPQIQGMPNNTSVLGNGSISGNVSTTSINKLQAADVTTIADTVKVFMDGILTTSMPGIKQGITKAIGNSPAAAKIDVNAMLSAWQKEYIVAIEKSRSVLENLFQSTMNTGFSKLFIGTAFIACFGVIFTLTLKSESHKMQG